MRGSLLGGVASLSAAAVLLALAWARLAGALFGEHVALAVGALAWLGLAAGGVAARALGEPGSAPRLHGRLTLAASGVAASSVVALLAFVRAPLVVTDAKTLLSLASLIALATVPLAFAGTALATALRDAREHTGTLCAAMWLGAVLGAAGATLAVGLGPLRGVLVAAFVAALAAAAFAWGSRRAAGELEIVATLVLAPAVLLVSDVMAPWLKLPAAVTAPRAEVQAWTDSGLVTVDRPMGGRAWVRVNGGSATVMLDAKAAVPREASDLAYALHEGQGPALVVGPGGGRDVRAALDAIHSEPGDVDVVEPQRYVAQELVGGRYSAFTGGLYERPEVHVILADARGHVASSAAHYRSIVVSSHDDAEAAANGARVLRPSELYTVEGVGDLLARLTPDGTLTLSASDKDRARLVGLALAALRARGVGEPLSHVFAASSSKTTSLVLALAPLPQPAIETLRAQVRRSRLTEVLAPDAPAPELVLAARALVPPTDDRPYLYADPAAARPLAVLGMRSAWRQHQGLWTLVLLLAVGAVAAVGTLAPCGPRRAGVGRLRARAFFAALGVGSALGAVALLERLASFAGGPRNAHAALLLAVLTGAAVGSLAAARVELARAALAARWRAVALVVLFAALAVLLDPAIGHLRGLGLSGRIAAAHTAVALLGALVGGLWSLGVRLVASEASALVPAGVAAWGAWALVGVAAGTWLLLAAGGAVALLLAGWAWALAAWASPCGEGGLEQAR
jgi:hypothetical protein